MAQKEKKTESESLWERTRVRNVLQSNEASSHKRMESLTNDRTINNKKKKKKM